MFGNGHAASVPMAIAPSRSYGSVGGSFFYLQQHAHPFPDHAAGGPGDRLRIMNLVSMTFGGLATRATAPLRDRGVAIDVIFGAFAAVALLSVAIVLLIRPRGSDVKS